MALVGTDWQVRIQPSATSSSVRALLHFIDTVPSSRRPMHVAQLPDSQENGGDIPTCRAVCRIVVPARCRAVSVRPSSSIVTMGATSATSPGSTGGVSTIGSAGVKRSMWIRSGSTPSERSVTSPGP